MAEPTKPAAQTVRAGTVDSTAEPAPPGVAREGLPDRFLLEIVTPERQLIADEVEALRFPGLDGEFGVLPGHTRMMSALGVGEVAYRKDGEWTLLVVASGFVEVLADRVIILAQTAEMAEEIDVERARAAKERAEERLAEPDPDTDIDRARAALDKALVRLQAAEKQRGVER